MLNMFLSFPRVSQRPKWRTPGADTEQTPREAELGLFRVVRRAVYQDWSKYTGEKLRELRKEHGVGRPPYWKAKNHG